MREEKLKVLVSTGFTINEVIEGTKAFARLGNEIDSGIIELNDLTYTSDEGNLAFM